MLLQSNSNLRSQLVSHLHMREREKWGERKRERGERGRGKTGQGEEKG